MLFPLAYNKPILDLFCRQQEEEIPLSVRSLKYLKLEERDFHPFISVFKHVPLKRQSVITAMASLKKSHAEDDAVSCLVVASENGDVYVLDPEAFTVLKQVCANFSLQLHSTSGISRHPSCL